MGSAVTTAAFVVVSVIGPGLPRWEQAIRVDGVEALPPAESGRRETVLPVPPSPTAVVPVDSLPAASEARVLEASSNQAATATSLPPPTVVAVDSSSVDSVMSRLEHGRIYIREMTAPDGSLLTLEGIISSDVRSIAVVNEIMFASGGWVADFVVEDVTRADAVAWMAKIAVTAYPRMCVSFDVPTSTCFDTGLHQKSGRGLSCL